MQNLSWMPMVVNICRVVIYEKVMDTFHCVYMKCEADLAVSSVLVCK